MQEAQRLSHKLLPLLNYATVYGVSFHKHVMWRRGILGSPHVRDPQKISLNADDIRAIEALWPLVADDTSELYPFV